MYKITLSANICICICTNTHTCVLSVCACTVCVRVHPRTRDPIRQPLHFSLLLIQKLKSNHWIWNNGKCHRPPGITVVTTYDQQVKYIASRDLPRSNCAFCSRHLCNNLMIYHLKHGSAPWYRQKKGSSWQLRWKGQVVPMFLNNEAQFFFLL